MTYNGNIDMIRKAFVEMLEHIWDNQHKLKEDVAVPLAVRYLLACFGTGFLNEWEKEHSLVVSSPGKVLLNIFMSNTLFSGTHLNGDIIFSFVHDWPKGETELFSHFPVLHNTVINVCRELPEFLTLSLGCLQGNLAIKREKNSSLCDCSLFCQSIGPHLQLLSCLIIEEADMSSSDTILPIAQHVAASKTINSLTLKSCNISPDSARFLASGLCSNTSLTSLDLSNNSTMADEGVNAIISAVSKTPASLSYLSFHSCGIRDVESSGLLKLCYWHATRSIPMVVLSSNAYDPLRLPHLQNPIKVAFVGSAVSGKTSLILRFLTVLHLLVKPI